MDNTMNDGINKLIVMTLDVWNTGLMGVDIGRIIGALLIFGLFLLLRDLFGKYVLYRVRDWAKDSKIKIDERILSAVIPPVKFIPIILGVFFAGQYLALSGDLDAFYDRILRSLIVFVIFWALYRAAEPFSHSFKRLDKILNKAIAQWIFRTLKVILVFIGAAVVLEIWGIAVGPLLAGLGLFGAAIALGAQDLFKNLIGGLTILAEKRFSPGDWILVEGVIEGIVEDIGFRSTKIRRFDKAPVHVPNASLSDTVVINFSRMTYRRVRWLIGVEYGTSAQQLRIIRDSILEYLKNHEAFAQAEDIGSNVYIDSFGPSSIDILVNCFTKSLAWEDWMQAKEDLAFAIKDIVETKAKTGFAFPSQTLYVETLPDTPPSWLAPAKPSKARKTV